MPYRLSSDGDCVEKASTGESMKCFTGPDAGEKAKKYLAALNINVKNSKTGELDDQSEALITNALSSYFADPVPNVTPATAPPSEMPPDEFVDSPAAAEGVHSPDSVNYVPDATAMNLGLCSACEYFHAGTCSLVTGPINPQGHCDLYVPGFAAGHMTVMQMAITKASHDATTGEMRWAAVTSNTERDLKQAKMSVALYRDFIRRIQTAEQAPAIFQSDYWKGGLPYLSVAHYLDQDGLAVAGPSTDIFIDGQLLKAKGLFKNEKDPSIALAAYEAVKKDIKDGVPQDKRVRISIAFLDWKHSHPDGATFARKSLTEQCPTCAAGVPVEEYLAGQLIHYALTRYPVNIYTRIVPLEVRSMTATQLSDAASIIGDDKANELEKREKEAVVELSAVVRRSDGDEEVTPPEEPVKPKEEGTAVLEPEAEPVVTLSVAPKPKIVTQEVRMAHQLDDAINSLRTEFDTVAADASLTREQKYAKMQPVMNSLAAVIARSVDGVTPLATSDLQQSIRSTVEEVLKPLMAQLQAATAQSAVQQSQANGNPPVRQFVPQGAPAVQQNKPGNVRSIVRRSVGLEGG